MDYGLMAKTPASRKEFPPDASLGFPSPPSDVTWSSLSKTRGSSGLRQYGGWVREEFLPQLRGRQAARTFREMQDNSPTVGAILFAIQQSMRQVSWRVEAANDKPDAVQGAEFIETCMEDMNQPWPDFISETLSMLPYGFAPHELVYKKRLGKRPHGNNANQRPSKFKDGKIGWAKIALRGQDTILKWFFDEEGDVTGLTQQPWFGGLIDIPMNKLLLFRPRAHKNNPEGNSILRSAYRPWWFTKRLEEQEAIALERMSGTPEYRIPNAVLEAAALGNPQALASLEQFKKIVTNIKVDEQMGLITPSDTYMNNDGTPSTVPQYEFRYNVPQGGRTAVNFDPSIERYKLDMTTSVLADFLMLGHSSRGTQSLGVTKLDLFFQATEGWLDSNAAVLNDYGVSRLWELNGEDDDTQPKFVPSMPQRTDLDSLGQFILALSQAGARIFPDDDLENYLREAADLPELSEGQLAAVDGIEGPASADPGVTPSANQEAARADVNRQTTQVLGGADMQKHIAGMVARRLERKGLLIRKSGRGKRNGT
jgi:hypothetical protein